MGLGKVVAPWMPSRSLCPSLTPVTNTTMLLRETLGATWTRQLTTPVDNSLDDTPEIVTVHDPTHPLYGKRFLVASRPTRPDAQGTHLLVFLRDTVQWRLPLRVTLPASTEQAVTTLTPDAVAELVATAQASGLWQSSP